MWVNCAQAVDNEAIGGLCCQPHLSSIINDQHGCTCSDVDVVADVKCASRRLDGRSSSQAVTWHVALLLHSAQKRLRGTVPTESFMDPVGDRGWQLLYR